MVNMWFIYYGSHNNALWLLQPYPNHSIMLFEYGCRNQNPSLRVDIKGLQQDIHLYAYALVLFHCTL